MGALNRQLTQPADDDDDYDDIYWNFNSIKSKKRERKTQFQNKHTRHTNKDAFSWMMVIIVTGMVSKMMNILI